MLWMLTDEKYDQLRKVSGCSRLKDLKATKSDAKHILRMAKSMGVKKEFIFVNKAAKIKEVKETAKKIYSISKAFDVEGKHHTLIFYGGGHGASYGEKQIYLLNGSAPVDVLYNIEQKLRTMASDEISSHLHVFAIYDCCRVPLKNMTGLSE